MTKPTKPARQYDAIVIGSGLTGSMAAMELCERGLDTIVLEAGPHAPDRLFSQEKVKISSNIGLRLRALSAGMYRLAKTLYLSQPLFEVLKATNSPYAVERGKPFEWLRVRVVNGRGLFWARLALRHTEQEMRAADLDGLGTNWPLSLAELEPFYQKAEQVLNVVGPKNVRCEHSSLTTPEGLEAMPVANWVAQRLQPELRVYNIRRARYQKAALSPMLERAAKTGQLTLSDNTVAARLVLDASGQHAIGVEIVDARTGQKDFVRARTVLLAASALESVRLLLNSPDEVRGHCVGNSSGLLGLGIMDHVHTTAIARIPELSTLVNTDKWDPMDMDVFARSGFYIPPFMSPDRDKGFARRYQVEGTALPKMVVLAACGEMLPNDENKVTLHPCRTDRWGIPILRIGVAWSENEKNMIRHQIKALRSIIKKLGGKQSYLHTFVARGFRRWPVPGASIHEVGGARMGTKPESSVVNSHGCLWDVPNVYICDGAVLPSMGYQNTTLTIMALSARAAQHAAETIGISRQPDDTAAVTESAMQD